MGFKEEHPETHIAIGTVNEDGEETYIAKWTHLGSNMEIKKVEDIGVRKSGKEKGGIKRILYGRNRRSRGRNMVIKKLLIIMFVSVIYVTNLNIPVTAEENEKMSFFHQIG